MLNAIPYEPSDDPTEVRAPCFLEPRGRKGPLPPPKTPPRAPRKGPPPLPARARFPLAPKAQSLRPAAPPLAAAAALRPEEPRKLRAGEDDVTVPMPPRDLPAVRDVREPRTTAHAKKGADITGSLTVVGPPPKPVLHRPPPVPPLDTLAPLRACGFTFPETPPPEPEPERVSLREIWQRVTEGWKRVTDNLAHPSLRWAAAFTALGVFAAVLLIVFFRGGDRGDLARAEREDSRSGDVTTPMTTQARPQPPPSLTLGPVLSDGTSLRPVEAAKDSASKAKADKPAAKSTASN